MENLLKKFEEKEPEIVFEWHDPQTEAVGWVVINSLRGGAAGGGTRMREGLDKREVVSLAKTMEIKFTVSGPQIGGAKSGINFNPQDPRKHGVLERWFKAVFPLLKNYYGTGGDMNIDEMHEVIPITEGFGLWHPQEGVVNGHFAPTEAQKINIIGNLRYGVSKIVENPAYTPKPSRRYAVADLITGYGVAQSVIHHYALRGESHRGKKVVVQGWGNVGSAAAGYLSYAGASVVGIIDRNAGIIAPEGLSWEEVKTLFLEKVGNELKSDRARPYAEIDREIWDMEADVFLPCAGSRLVTKAHVDRMVNAGLELISSGANVPFADSEIFFGPTMSYTDQKISLIPDFIANSGMARVFAHCMSQGRDGQVTDDAIFKDVSDVIHKALQPLYHSNPNGKNLSKTAFENALTQLI